LELRKKSAFLGYTWRRMNRDDGGLGRVGIGMGGDGVGVLPRKRGSMVWMRGRLSLH